MILSKYNIYAEKDNVVTIFNTLTSALVQLNKNSFDNLLTDNNNPSTISKLLDMGILVESR